jgi:HEAT repeats
MKSRRPDRAFIARAEREDDLAALVRGVIAVALHDRDFVYAQDLCLRLARHTNFNVRGNALQAMGHLVRMHHRLDEAEVRPVLERSLHDGSEYVRSQAEEARDETTRVLGWKWEL